MPTQTGSLDLKAAKGAYGDGSKTATNYITYIDSTNGIRIYDGQSANQNVNFAQINSDGMQIYKDSTSVAEYGDEVTIGKQSAYNVVIGENDIAFNKNGEEISNISNSVETAFTKTDLATKTAYGKAGITLGAGSKTSVIGSSSALLYANDATGESDTYSSIKAERTGGGIQGKQRFVLTSDYNSSTYGTAHCEINGETGLVRVVTSSSSSYVPTSTLKFNANLIYVELDSNGTSSAAATSGRDKDLFNAIRALGWYSDVIV